MVRMVKPNMILTINTQMTELMNSHMCISG